MASAQSRSTAPADLPAAVVSHGDHITATELTFDSDDADRQQALAAVPDLAYGSAVDRDGAPQLQVIAHPLLASRHFRGRGDERRSQ